MTLKRIEKNSSSSTENFYVKITKLEFCARRALYAGNTIYVLLDVLSLEQFLIDEICRVYECLQFHQYVSSIGVLLQ